MIKKSDSHSTAKAIIMLMVVMLAFLILVIFMDRKEALAQSGDLTTFINLTIVGMGFLIVLVYFVNQSGHHPHDSSKKKKKR
ncbi:MAG: hypothetical protein HY429_03710 [Candidatus Levybacteria bacterium]|nr:hypothetical protein [Candidatus Levybacteria bacterium]